MGDQQTGRSHSRARWDEATNTVTFEFSRAHADPCPAAEIDALWAMLGEQLTRHPALTAFRTAWRARGRPISETSRPYAVWITEAEDDEANEGDFTVRVRY
ncbi:MAG: hypothetical protein M3Q71_14805 [Chloroflexota bacterium]|nr:hypothetical protein [Chloroflexota bacterium]